MACFRNLSIGLRFSSIPALKASRPQARPRRACDPMLIEAHALQTLAVDHHVVAAVSITGTFIDVIGSLFLAYDLLGGQHGPLRLITRAVTYSLVFSMGYALTLRQFWAALVRTIGYIALSLLCSLFIRHLDHVWAFAFRVGIVTGLATALGNLLNPYIEFYADNLPERRLGVFGILLILCGFTLQSVQYWLAYLDIRLT